VTCGPSRFTGSPHPKLPSKSGWAIYCDQLAGESRQGGTCSATHVGRFRPGSKMPYTQPRFGASPLLHADVLANLWRRGLPQSPEKRQDVVTSITDAIPICFLSCKGEINTHACGLYTGIFLDSWNSSGSVQYYYLWDIQSFWMHFCLSCPIALTSPKFSEIFLNILM